jgi:DNA polymerase III delta subunit
MLLVKKSLNSSKKGLMDLTGLKFEFQIDNVINNCYSFKEKELEDLLIYLCDLDHNIKIGKVSNKLALQLFILKCAI